jgi:hypothetical protein
MEKNLEHRKLTLRVIALPSRIILALGCLGGFPSSKFSLLPFPFLLTFY